MGNRVLRKDIYGPQKILYLLREVGILVADTDRPVVLDPGHPAPVIVKADRGLQRAPGAGETERILPMHVGNIRQGSVFQQQFHFRDVVTPVVIYLLALSFANRNRGFWRLSDNAQSITSLPEDRNEQRRLYGFPVTANPPVVVCVSGGVSAEKR